VVARPNKKANAIARIGFKVFGWFYFGCLFLNL